MSGIEAYTGKLVPVDYKGLTMDEWIKNKLEVNVRPNYFSSWLEFLEDEFYKQYHYDRTSGILYEVEKTEFSPESFVQVLSNDDGSYSFSTSFYNGGVSFSEMLQEGLDNLR